MTMTMTPAFATAVQRVVHDTTLDAGRGADLVAVGIERGDCLAFLRDMIEDDVISPELLAIIVQWSVAIGVWIERARWEGWS